MVGQQAATSEFEIPPKKVIKILNFAPKVYTRKYKTYTKKISSSKTFFSAKFVNFLQHIQFFQYYKKNVKEELLFVNI